MSHCVHIIIASRDFADTIRERWPELPSLLHMSGFVLFPVNYDLIDAKIVPIVSPRETSDEFMLLTPAFQQYLGLLSKGGRLAYLETEYWAGNGGQGALVYDDGNLIMLPKWDSSGTINSALELLGVNNPIVGDRFTAIGLQDMRHNEDILDSILP